MNTKLSGKSDTSHTHNYLSPIWGNFTGTIGSGLFQGSIFVYHRNGGFKQITVQGSLLNDMAWNSGSRYIGSIPSEVYPDIDIKIPVITNNGKTIRVIIGTNGAINVQNYSLNSALLLTNDHFEFTHVYY